MPPSLIEPVLAESPSTAPCCSCYVSQSSVDENLRFKDLRSVQWRINLGILPSSSIDDIRRVTADSRRRYAGLRRRLLVDPHIPKDVSTSDVVDNPLSQNPDSTWSQFFRNAELEKMVDQDLTRLYPEHGSYFQTPGCQGMLRRILLLWCLRHPEYGYRQGMHELLAPLLYVVHVDVERLSHVRELYENLFTDKFDGLSFYDNDLYSFNSAKPPGSINNEIGSNKNVPKAKSFDEHGPEIQTIILLSDAYGAEGELGIVLSEKFMEHDAFCMFDALMSGSHGSVSMAEFFSPIPACEASAALYHLLSFVDSSLHSHLVELGVEPQYFALRWLRVLFGREFTLSDLLIIWDEIFASDDSRIDRSGEDNGSSYFGVLCSARGAFISAFAVSMLLFLRSSLLASENATSCLERLLKFPENVDLKKLLEKTKSLHGLALTTNTSSTHPSFSSRPYDYSRSMAVGGHRHSLDSISPKSLLNLVPESYWEEKWRTVLHKEELKQDDLKKQRPTQRKRWTEKVKLVLSRSESAPCSTKHENRRNHHKSSVRRRLLEDLSRELGFNEDPDTLGCHEYLGYDDKILVEETNEDDGDNKNLNSNAEERRVSANTGSEDNLSVFSDARSPHFGTNDNDNESKRSSVSSNSCVDDKDNNHCSSPGDQQSLQTSDPPEDLSQKSESNNDSTGNSAAEIREQKISSGKFQWLRKFSRNNSAGGTCEKGGSDEEDTKSVNKSDHQKANGSCNSLASCKGSAIIDQNMKGTLKNLGHSMLEHIQVIESTFQQDRSLVGKGQVTAVTALKELRKISNLLTEM